MCALSLSLVLIAVSGCDGSLEAYGLSEDAVDTHEPASAALLVEDETTTDASSPPTATTPTDTASPTSAEDTDDEHTADTGPPGPALPSWSCPYGDTVTFDPPVLYAGDVVHIHPSSYTPYAWVDVQVPGATTRWVGVSGASPWTWDWEITGLSEGAHPFEFTSDQGAVVRCTGTLQVN